MRSLGLHVSVVARPPARSSQTLRRRSRHWIGVVAAAAAVMPAGIVSAVPALADSTSGNTTATINVAVRSLKVTPSSTSFDSCQVSPGGASTGSTLAFPNGYCQTNLAADQITITNGAAPSNVDINGADAIPADGGTHWTLCFAGVACTGSGGPGVDQFAEAAIGISSSRNSGFLSTTPQCDTAFSAGSCAAQPGEATTELLTLDGPKESTDNSSSFTTVWTWTAVP